METFERNITNLHGESGKEWLLSLPMTIEKLSQRWQLTDIHPVNRMSWNYVALAMQKNTIPVALKISFDKALIHAEYNTLKHFNGKGAIKVIEINPDYNALLLEQAIPGYLLKERHHTKIVDTITIYANVVKLLAENKLPAESYTHVSEWCAAIDSMNDPRVAKHYVDKAKQLRAELFNTVEREYLCHGDLHFENIIQQGSDWVAIDPKGIIGEIAFEASAFDLISQDEMRDVDTVEAKIIHRLTLLSDALEINFDRLLAWVFLRIIISTQWFIEDHGDPSHMLILAGYVYPLLSRRS